MDILLRITADMQMVAFCTKAGHDGDHNFTRFTVKRPSTLDGYSCRVDFKGITKSCIFADDNTFALPSALAKAGEFQLQLVFTRADSEVVAKTSVVALYIGESINAVDPTDTEFVDGLGQVAAQLSDHEIRITALEDGGQTGQGGTKDHGELKNRDMPNQHPASAIAFDDGDSFQDKYDSGELTGPKGEPGSKGETGAQGEKGEPGAAGPKGDTGESFDPADVERITALEDSVGDISTALDAIMGV